MVRVVAQRVRSASVTVRDEIVGSIGIGLMLLVGVADGDDEPAIDRLADKVAFMRIFEDGDGKMNLSTADVEGAMLVISQFTLYGDMSKGRRPSFVQAAAQVVAERLYEHFTARLRSHGYEVACGRFGAHMLVRLENDGPVTLILDSATA